MRVLLALTLALGVSPAVAQPVGDCELGTAEGDLDVNDVRARVFNTGALFYGNTTTDGTGYLVPKRAGYLSPIFATDLWIGGKVDGELRVAGARYDRFEFWPGPLDEDGRVPDPLDCTTYDRIFVVSRNDIARYYATSEATDDLRDWPVDWGAPVLDGDGVEGNYNLAGGDQPALRGEQTAWWVMNDAGNEHRFSLTPPMQVEVQVEAFAAPSPVAAMNQATFYRYHIRYRGSAPLDSAYVALWSDFDLGDSGDDYVGSDTTLDLAFVYNASEPDGVYGTPPAAGMSVLHGPVGLPNGRDDDRDGNVDEPAERLRMTAAPCYAKWLEVVDGAGMYNCMQGRWPDGRPLVENVYGYPFLDDDGETDEEYDGPPIAFSFPGDPVTDQFWSEGNIDGEGTDAGSGDRRHMIVTGPFRLEPGEAEDVVFAIPFAQGADRFDSIIKLRQATRYVQNAFDLGVFEPRLVPGAPGPPDPPSAYGLSQPFPNPFRSSAALTLTVPEGAAPLHLAVYDVLGREVALLAEGVLPPGDHPLTLGGESLPSGLYLVRLETGRQTETLKVLHIE